MTVSTARSTWASAGFTGAFTPAAGLNNKIVLGQTIAPGDCLPSTTEIEVTY
jgi:hypothetical protein